MQWDKSEHPRDKDGKFTDGNGAFSNFGGKSKNKTRSFKYFGKSVDTNGGKS